MESILRDARTRMDKTIKAFEAELGKLRTGRAHPSLLDHVHVDLYGTEVPISQAATVTALDAQTLSVQPWDRNMVSAIEKAIRDSDLGLNPVVVGELLRVPLPPLTEERRRELARVVGHEAENARVAVRNVRRDANHRLKALLREKAITEDEERRAEAEIQKLTDEHVRCIDALAAEKEQELMAL